MPNGEETTPTAKTSTEERLHELLERKDRELSELKGKLEDTKSDLRATERDLRATKGDLEAEEGKTTNAKKALSELKEQLEDAKSGLRATERDLRATKGDLEAEEGKTTNAKKALEEQEKVAQTAQERADDLEAQLNEAKNSVSIFEEEKEARRGLSEFVEQSISDILAGVDNAAVEARRRQLDGSLKESGFITPGSVGSIAQRGRDSNVEFDLAVVAGEQHTEEQGDGTNSEVKTRVSFMNVIPLGFSAEARRELRKERRSEERRNLTRHNRIRFSVPVTFACLDDPME